MPNGAFITTLIVFPVIMAIAILITYRLASRRDAPRVQPPAAETPASTQDSSESTDPVESAAHFEAREVEYNLLLEMNKILASASTFDELARGIVEAVSAKLRASHCALLWNSPGVAILQLKYGKGYGDAIEVPLRSSLAGGCLLKRQPVFCINPRQEFQYVPIPGAPESNLLCVPIKMFSEFRAVLRVANIDASVVAATDLAAIFSRLAPLISSALEKNLISQENERRKNELLAISGITQALNRTVNVEEIALACARHLKPIFNYTYCSVVRFVEKDNVALLAAVPKEIKFAESEASSQIILRNLCAKRESVYIESVSRSNAIRCQNRDVGSIIVMPITIANQSFGAVIVTNTAEKAFKPDDVNVLSGLVEHLALTIERAMFFKKQQSDAMIDGLTGLLNRRMFQERLRLELIRYQRYKRPFTLVMLDIDHFKKFNDTHGHQTGDAVLRTVAGAIRASIRSTDMAFRYGGEEMCVILVETELDPSTIFGRRLMAKVREATVSSAQGDLHVTASFGFAQVAPDLATPEALIFAADKAMYFAKENGRNCIAISRNGVPEKISEAQPPSFAKSPPA